MKDTNQSILHKDGISYVLPFILVTCCFAGFIPFGEFVSSNGTAYHIHIDMKVACISIATAVCAIALATWMFAREDQRVPDSLASRFSGLHKAPSSLSTLLLPCSS